MRDRLRFGGFGASLAGLLLATASLSAQQSRAAKGKAAVEFLYPEQVTLEAGKPKRVSLHFRVAEGMHINSHTPPDADLVPTTLALPAESGVKLESARYPKGQAFALPLDPKTKLDVYTGEFTIEAELTATAGDRLMEARLRYQACDNAECMPPKTLIVPVDVRSK